MIFQELLFGSADYERTLDLRKRILRDPLGLEWTDEEIAWEPRERHFVLAEGEEVIACVVARALEAGTMKLRQMAVEPTHQRRGWGRRLLERVEPVLRADGVKRIELNARNSAIGFYEGLGYERVGQEFLEVGIPHWKMAKVLV